MSSNTLTHAEKEIEILLRTSTDPDDRPIIEEFIPEILALVDKFGNSGQSGGSAPYTANAIANAVKKLCLQETIAPLTGEDSEWYEVGRFGPDDNIIQNNRESAVFKDGKNARPHYLDAVIFKGEDEWDQFTGTVDDICSRQYIKSFPFTPKRFYIDVVIEQLPEDWTEEPYFEGKDWYDTAEFEQTGVKNWHKGKYRYHIKDRSQLDEVFEYYDKFERQ